MAKIIQFPKKAPTYAFWILPMGSKEREDVLKNILESILENKGAL